MPFAWARSGLCPNRVPIRPRNLACPRPFDGSSPVMRRPQPGHEPSPRRGSCSPTAARTALAAETRPNLLIQLKNFGSFELHGAVAEPGLGALVGGQCSPLFKGAYSSSRVPAGSLSASSTAWRV
jgi:hypothetical protein